MEKVFVHPECPFSTETFSLLAEFSENPSSDFHITHKKDFLKYVEKPVKYILSQVEDQLPDFIKKYINIKYESCCLIDSSKYSESTVVYRVDYCNFNSMIPLEAAQLMLKLEYPTLTFGLKAQKTVFEFMLYNYKKKYRNDLDSVEILKGYNLPNKDEFYLDYSIEKEPDGYYRVPRTLNWQDIVFTSTKKPRKYTCIYELLESILKELPLDSLESENFSEASLELERQMIFLNDIFVGISLDLQEILGYSVQQIVYKIAQTFKKVFPLFLISNKNLPLLISEYFSVYEQEFNPVYQLEKISKLTGFQTTQLTQWIHAINRKGQAIIQGPPGTGKTFIAEKLAKHLIGGGDGFSDIIQFHPAYTYEDFIEGLRPTTKNGQLTYSIVPGRFLEFCEKAEVCEDNCVLIIDEINRANLSQVFGELMYLLDDRDRTVKLASGQQFKIPTNVRIIGTMNTADRSIALVDNALRRRFAFIPVYPNYEVLRQYHQREKTGFPVDKLTSILENVNRAINNKHYELGISFFLTKTLAEDIQDIWQMEIEPYLEEYFFDNQEKMDEFCWYKIKDKFSK
ncbi:AAA family ATPase [Microcoleus sp. CAWBG58]|uniref:McrB family protein n=1 Tax=Microcoleus sp. CAWBG58 TaxID=2841651 RepID=UPI0025CC7608|nr:AAA family ATPase [Microcoleus sp. CAWBG58]